MQETPSGAGPIWRKVPNAISIARLCATMVLLFAALLHRSELFKWLLLACLLSDILDGLIARSFHLTSKLGASLDSIADVTTMLMAMLGIAVFQRAFLTEHFTAVTVVIAFYIGEVIAALIRYGKLSSFHTLLDRVAAYAAGIFIMSLFLWGYQAWLFQIAVTVYIVALTEEMLLIWLLPEWRSDVWSVFRVLAEEGKRP